jgi:hypothetical protein
MAHRCVLQCGKHLEVVYMTENITEPVRCHDGRCRYRRKDQLDNCIGCDFAEQIKHDLLRCNVRGC